MPDTFQLLLGAEVACTDGHCGLVHSLVVDPKAKRVTHLVAEPEHRVGLGRLVPVDLVDAVAGGVRLSCDLATFDQLPHAEDTEVIAGAPIEYARFTGWLGAPAPPQTDVRDVLPPGEVGMSSGVVVSATDGPIGVVAGFAIDRRRPCHRRRPRPARTGSYGVTRWSASRSAAVTDLRDGVQLNLATADVPCG